jgi:hypothetical protein
MISFVLSNYERDAHYLGKEGRRDHLDRNGRLFVGAVLFGTAPLADMRRDLIPISIRTRFSAHTGVGREGGRSLMDAQ